MSHVNINLQGHFLDSFSEIHQNNGYHPVHNGLEIIHRGIDLFMEPEHRNGKSNGEATDRRQMMQRLEASENKLKNFISQSFEGILMFDHDGRITEWNPAIEKITGIPKKKASGCFIWDMMWQLDPEEIRTPQRKERLRNEMLEYMEDGENEDPVLEERTLLATNGLIHHVRMSMFPVKLSAGVCHYGSIMRDITLQRKVDTELNRYRTNLEQMVKAQIHELLLAKENAEKDNRLKSVFLENMSNELRTPLDGIVGLLNLLAADVQLPENIREYIDLINKNGDQLRSLMDNILDMAKTEADKIKLT